MLRRCRASRCVVELSTSDRDDPKLRISGVDESRLVYASRRRDVVVRVAVPAAINVCSVHNPRIVVRDGFLVIQILWGGEGGRLEKGAAIEFRVQARDDGVARVIAARCEGTGVGAEDITRRRLGEFLVAEGEVAIRRDLTRDDAGCLGVECHLCVCETLPYLVDVGF